MGTSKNSPHEISAERTILYETLEGFYGTDRSGAPTDGSDQSYRFYPYYPVEGDTAE